MYLNLFKMKIAVQINEILKNEQFESKKMK